MHIQGGSKTTSKISQVRDIKTSMFYIDMRGCELNI